MKVGFIGLGRMGQGMARRVLDAGNDLVVYNRTPAKAKDLGDAGATVVDSIAAAAADRDVVITMITDDAAIEAVARGEGGLVAALPAGTIHLAMGTHSVDMTRAIAAAHAASAAQRVFNEMHQFSGAMGFTREHDLHVWSMRLQALRLEAGGVAGHRRAAAGARWVRAS